MDDVAARRAFLFASTGLCLILGLALRASALVALAFALFLLLAQAWRASRRRLAPLGVRREMPESAFEDEEARVVLSLENHGRAPVTLVDVIDAFGPAHADRQAVLETGPLAGGRRRRLAYRTTCSRLWGVYAVGPLTVRVSDGLGLFRASRAIPDVRPFDLFPRVHPVPALEELGSRPSFAPAEATTGRPGQSAAYLGVRDFREGDALRHVHWPATARRGVPMVKERELDLTPYFTLFLDLEREHRAGTGQKSTLEYIVRTAACLLSSAARRGDTVQAFAESTRPVAIPPGRGELHLAHALDQLIRVRQDGRLPLLELVAAHQAALPVGSTAALLTATLFLELGALAETLAALRSRRTHAVLVAVDKDSFAPIDRRVRPRAEVEAQRDALLALASSYGAHVAVLTGGHDLEAELQRPDWVVAP